MKKTTFKVGEIYRLETFRYSIYRKLLSLHLVDIRGFETQEYKAVFLRLEKFELETWQLRHLYVPMAWKIIK
jgi:hypothetical protein